MSTLFQATTINGMKLANRFMRSATWEGMAADDGSCTPGLKELYVRLAQGGVGLIITSHTYVRRDGMGSPRQLGLSDDTFIPGLREMTDAVHRHNGRVAVELSHAGILSNPKVTGSYACGSFQGGWLCRIRRQRHDDRGYPGDD